MMTRTTAPRAKPRLMLAADPRGPADDRARPTARELLINNPYGLTLREARAEIRRCAARGWQLWEIRARFAPESMTCITHVLPCDQALSRVREGTGGGS
jgi:hypothetical protein